MRPDEWSCLEFHLEACPCERSYSCCWLYYWVFLSSDRPCQVYYKVRQVSLQRTTDFFFLLQSVTSVITKCDRYFKVGRLLQSATEQTYIVYWFYFMEGEFSCRYISRNSVWTLRATKQNLSTFIYVLGSELYSIQAM